MYKREENLGFLLFRIQGVGANSGFRAQGRGGFRRLESGQSPQKHSLRFRVRDSTDEGSRVSWAPTTL